MSRHLRILGRFGTVLVLTALLLGSFGAVSAKGPVEEGSATLDPHTPVSSDGSAVKEDLAGILYDELGAYVPESEGSGKEAEGADRTADDNDPEISPALPSGHASPDSVIGNDNRTRITSTTSTPYRRIVHITFKRGSGSYQCTGWLINANTVATAGHCVYSGGQWVTNVRVYPGRNGSSSPYGSCGYTRLHTVSGWTQSSSPNYDYGAIKLNCTVGNQTGSFGYRVASSSSLSGQTTKIAGYPGDKASGTMWYHADQVRSYSTYRIYYSNDTYGGQSGSPVYNSAGNCSNCAIGIHTNGTGGSSYNSGTRITQTVFNNLTTWKNNN